MKKLCLLILLFCVSAAFADAPRGFVGDDGVTWDTTSAVSTRASFQRTDRPAENTINGSGMNADGLLHEEGWPGDEGWINHLNMWYAYTGDNQQTAAQGANEWWGIGRRYQGLGASDPALVDASPGDSSIWIEFALDEAVAMDEIWIWNYAEGYKDSFSYSKQAIQNCTIKYTSTDSGVDAWGSYDAADWTELYAGDLADYELNEDIAANNIFDFGGDLVKYVVITVPVSDTDVAIQEATNWTDERATFAQGWGLSEVRFYPVPEPATMMLLGLGSLALARRRK